METWESFLLNFGAVLILLLTLSPAPAMREAWKKQSTKVLSASFLLACHSCGFFWIIYALSAKNYQMMYNNIPPFLVSLLWLCVFFAIEKKLFGFLLKYTTVTLATTAVLLNWFDLNSIGLIAMFANFWIILAPLEFVSKALATKDPNRIDLNILSASALCSLDWTLYGWVIKDIFVTTTNAFGFSISLLQFTVYMWAKGYLPHRFLAPLANFTKVQS